MLGWGLLAAILALAGEEVDNLKEAWREGVAKGKTEPDADGLYIGYDGRTYDWITDELVIKTHNFQNGHEVIENRKGKIIRDLTNIENKKLNNLRIDNNASVLIDQEQNFEWLYHMYHKECKEINCVKCTGVLYLKYKDVKPREDKRVIKFKKTNGECWSQYVDRIIITKERDRYYYYNMDEREFWKPSDAQRLQDLRRGEIIEDNLEWLTERTNDLINDFSPYILGDEIGDIYERNLTAEDYKLLRENGLL